MHPKLHFKNKALLFLALLIITFTGFAQAPNLLNYQGVARNSVGNPLPNQTMKLRLSIHNLLPSGAVVYSEIRQITTNLGGLFSVQIGSGGASNTTGTIAGVNWIVGDKFLQVELDPASNNNYLDIGTVQLVSVPYAFAAGTAATVKSNANLTGVVTSVGNQTSIANGAITSDMIASINKSKVGLDLVNNTSDASKPISNLTQAALGNKLNIADSTSAYVTPTQLTANKLDSTSISNRINLKANISSLATVATSGSYNDLTNKPTVPAAYSLPTASALSLGGIKVGSNLSIDGNGVLSGASAYSLPSASASELGGVKVGTGLTIANGVLSASSSGVPYTGATQAVDLGAFDLMVNGITVGRGKNGLDNNVGIGKNVLSNTIMGFQGNYLTAVGYEALKANTWGYFNTGIGSSALFSNIAGLANTAIGSNSLLNNTYGNYNTAVGTSALQVNTDKGNHTAIGAGALQNNSTGEFNSALGYNALNKNTSGSNNTATGVNALLENTTGSANTANGAYSLQLNTIGSSNTATGLSALKSNTTGGSNTATGVNALFSNINGNENTANGAYALFSNTEGRENSAFGFSALKSNTSGKYNTATGFNALSRNTTGEQNTATGWYALGLNTTGANNTAFGWYSLYPNTTGANNTAVGEGALKNNSTGDDNSAFGEGTLANNTTGIYNSAFGRESLHFSSGANNTAIGWRSGFANTTGSNNTAIGASANFGANNLTNATAIGYQASVSASDKIRLGNGSVTVIEGAVNFTAASDSRIKKNIINSNYGLSTVLQLRPVEYNLISNDLRQVGFIAQEVQKLVPEVVTGKEGDLNKGEILGITYSNLVPVLTKAIQEQQKQIEELKALVNQLINKKN